VKLVAVPTLAVAIVVVGEERKYVEGDVEPNFQVGRFFVVMMMVVMAVALS